MGQYYHPLLIDKDGAKYTACSHDFDNGLKLMEHSWVGNNFVNAILNMLSGHPMRVAWLGDYSSSECDQYDLGGGFVKGREDFMRYYKSAYDRKVADNDADSVKTIKNDGKEYLFDLEHADCFLVNMTKGCYIDLAEYVSENNFTPSWDNALYCINPLPLLTCVGNGMGGGDYSGINGADVGIWAFDEIYVTVLKPANLEKIMYHFL